jgi:ATP-dependent RNA helicase HelY
MSRKGGRAHARRKLVTPTRLEVVEMLDEERLLPAIYFIFSRNACDDAAAQCHRAHIVLTDAVERRRIREIAEARLSGLSDHDLDVLGVEQFLAQLENGIAAHHAGMIPPFKETVETCFVEGLVKVVFATETLAVGINMPARSVVIEKLTKFTGEHHTFLTAGEFTQLTGRAGRRGIDTEGHAVVLWNPFITFDQVATLVTSRSFHLNSAFRPTYNMAANLVRTYSAEEAHHLLNLSFAQYQADRDLVRIEARIERRSEHLRRLREDAASPFGDIEDFRAQRQRGAVGHGEERDIDLALAKLRPGDVLYVRKGTYSGPAVVLTVAARKSGMKITVLTRSRLEVTFTAADFDRAPVAIGSIELPQPFAPGRPEFQRETLERLARESLRGRDVAPLDAAHGPQTHPVEEDPDLEHRLSLSVQADRVAREIEGLRERVGGRSRSVSRQFDRVLGVLERRGYVSSWVLTERGQILARLFHECDLLVAEALHARLLDGLDAPHLAALVSVFVYEHRSPEPPPEPWFPSGAMRTRFNRISALSQEIRVEEERNGMTPHRAPDPTFVAISYAWASGEGFAEIVDAEDLSGGDFVRTTKQLIDLLRQLALVSPERATRAAAADAADRLFRGVVAASSMVSGVEGEEVEG